MPWLLEVAAQGLCSASGSFRGDPETGLIQLQAAVLAGRVTRHGDRADGWREECSITITAAFNQWLTLDQPQQLCEVDVIIVLILQARTLRFREIKALHQSHPARKWMSTA